VCIFSTLIGETFAKDFNVCVCDVLQVFTTCQGNRNPVRLSNEPSLCVRGSQTLESR